MSKLHVAAVVTVYRPDRMTKRGRKQIASWLRKQARHFVARGELYTKGRFTALYLFEDKQ